MIIEITADTVVWFIALMLAAISALLFLVLMALRILVATINVQMAALTKKIPKFGGGGGDSGGEPAGLGGLLQMGMGLLGGGT